MVSSPVLIDLIEGGVAGPGHLDVASDFTQLRLEQLLYRAATSCIKPYLQSVCASEVVLALLRDARDQRLDPGLLLYIASRLTCSSSMRPFLSSLRTSSLSLLSAVKHTTEGILQPLETPTLLLEELPPTADQGSIARVAI